VHRLHGQYSSGGRHQGRAEQAPQDRYCPAPNTRWASPTCSAAVSHRPMVLSVSSPLRAFFSYCCSGQASRRQEGAAQTMRQLAAYSRAPQLPRPELHLTPNNSQNFARHQDEALQHGFISLPTSPILAPTPPTSTHRQVQALQHGLHPHILGVLRLGAAPHLAQLKVHRVQVWLGG